MPKLSRDADDAISAMQNAGRDLVRASNAWKKYARFLDPDTTKVDQEKANELKKEIDKLSRSVGALSDQLAEFGMSH